MQAPHPPHEPSHRKNGHLYADWNPLQPRTELPAWAAQLSTKKKYDLPFGKQLTAAEIEEHLQVSPALHVSGRVD